MRVMVFDVAASTGGAVSILEDFVQQINENQANKISWIFILSKIKIPNSQKIKSYNFEWIKKSWFHRLYFDLFYANYLIKKYKIDHVFSMQNLVIPFCKCKQTIYLHNALPFEDNVANPLIEFKLWIYVLLIKPLVFLSIKYCDHIIVQTNWFKEKIIQQCNVESNKLTVISPKVFIEKYDEVVQKTKKINFFYPTASYNYKNNSLIIDAVKLLKIKNSRDFSVIMTLDKNQNKLSKKLYKIIEKNDLPIQFIGRIQREEVLKRYATSVLIFPSKIETYGLPLIEAKLFDSLIFAVDKPYSREILDGYENVYFFNDKSEELSNIMDNLLNENIIKKVVHSKDIEIGTTILDYFNNFTFVLI